LYGHHQHHIDLSENTAMRHILCLITVSASLLATNAMAQANILGLPAVPQTPVQPAAQPAPQATASAPKVGASAAAKNAKQSASAARAGASGAKPGAALPQESINDVEDKSVLSGGVTMASSYEGKLATVRVTTNNVYQGEVYRSQAIKAAKLVQRDLVTSCAWQCKPAPMPAPQILADGKLQFVMAIDNYPRVLSYDDMITMLLGKPLAVTPKPTVTATVGAPTAPTVPASATAPRPAAVPPVANALPPGVVRSSNLDTVTQAAPVK
jgi:hypothetical protein